MILNVALIKIYHVDPVEACKKVLGMVLVSFDEFFITCRIGAEIALQSRSFGNVHISRYSTFDRRTALCK